MHWAIFCACVSALISLGVTQGIISVLDMAPNSFDDQYKDCADQMEQRIISDGLLQNELSRNSHLKQQWDSSTQEWRKRKNSGSLPPLPDSFKEEYGIALLTYTGGLIYRDFNAAVMLGGQSTGYYMDNFHFKSLHFYITRAFQLLRTPCKTHAKDVYRGVTSIRYVPPKKTENSMRLAQFTTTSLDKKKAEEIGTGSFFTIRTCFGVMIEKFSFYPDEAEVLIPANEVFNVTKYTEEGHKFVLNSTQSTCSKFNCAYLNGKEPESSFPHCIYNSAPGGDNTFPVPLLFSGFLMINAGVLRIFSIN